MTLKQNLIQFIAATLLLILAGAILMSLGSIRSHALVGQDGIGVVPTNKDDSEPLTRGWFIQKLNPGQSVDLSADIINNNESEKTIEIRAKDSEQTGEGSFSFIPNETKDTMVGSWIKLSQDKITLPGQKMSSVKFTISVPSDTKPGEYSGVIAVQTASENNGAIKTVSRVGARVYITVPGDLKTGTDVPRFEFINPSTKDYTQYVGATIDQPFDKMYLALDLKNNGNIFQKSKGSVEIMTPTETVKLDFDRDFAPVGNVVNILLNSTKTWQVGNYKAKFTFEDKAIISSNKGDVKDSSPNKTVETSFEMTQAILDQMKKDKEDKAGARAKANDTGKLTGTSAPVQIIAAPQLANTGGAKMDTNTIIYVIGGIIIVALFGIIGFLLYKQNKKEKKPAEVKTETPKPAETSQKPSIKK